MNSKEQIAAPKLLGWDDGKIYYYNEEGKEKCVTDDAILFAKILETIKNYYKKQK